MRTHHLGAAALALVAAPTAAHAGGLFIPGIGPMSQSRAGASVASVDDPSAIGTNPAGLTEAEGVTVIVGSRFLGHEQTFQRRGRYAETDAMNPWDGERYPLMENEGKPPIGLGRFQALPMIAVSIDLDKQVKGLHLGAGLVVPTSFPTRDYGSDYEINTESIDETEPPPPTRYDTVKQEAAILMPSVAAAYRINDMFSVGGRFTWGIGNLKATTYAWGPSINYDEWVQEDAEFSIDAADNFAPAFALGVMAHATDAIDVGFNWDSGMKLHAVGTGSARPGFGSRVVPSEPINFEPSENPACAAGGTREALKACVDLALPMVTTLGGRYKLLDGNGAEKGDIELNVAWERWSAASDYKVIVDAVASGLALNPTTIRHNFQDVFSFRLGGHYQLPVGAGLRIDAGIAHDTAAAPEGWERLDIDGAARTTFAAGARYPVSKKVELSLGGGYVYEGARNNANDCNPTAANPGCDGDGTDTPFSQRGGPDPAQPITGAVPIESPFNAGRYWSRYIEISFAAIMKF